MDGRIHPPTLDTDYPAIRRAMGPERQLLDDETLEELVADAFGGAQPEDVEDLMRSIQTFGKHVAPVAQKALPGVIQGATTGATVAGPWGAVAGAIGGGATSALARGGPPKRARTPAAPPSMPRPPAIAPPPAAAPAQGRPMAMTASPAAAQLLALLSRPETLLALQSLLLANLGRGTVQVGPRHVLAAEFANAISETAAEAVTEAVPYTGASLPEHLADDYGHPRADIANPGDRAALLAADLNEVAESEAAAEAPSDRWSDESSQPFILDASDVLDHYEAALSGGWRDGS